MTNKKSTKRALLMSALALLMCVSMLVGSSFAWFTDSVTSGNNIIKSGTLDITMEWKDATATGAQKTYKDASTGPIFNYDLWEPGYVEAKNIKIDNAGTLALKYQLNILATGEVSKLADVIDVYYAEGEHTLASRDMSELTLIGNLSTVLAGMSTTANGDLLEGETDTVTLALKMQETANNDYQGLSIGSSFAVQLMATQLTSEFDSFDNQYDKMATIDTEAELLEALAADYDMVQLGANIEMAGNIEIPAGKTVAIDLAGYTMSQGKDDIDTTYALIWNYGTLTIKDSVGTGKISFADTTPYAAAIGWASNTIRNEGTLTVAGGTVENTTAEAVMNFGYPHAIDVFPGSVTNVTGGTVKSANYDSIRMFCNSTTKATTVNISGGNIVNRVSFQNPDNNRHTPGYGVLNISGGNFTTTNGVSANVRLLNFSRDFSNMKATVTGGTFDKGFKTQDLANCGVKTSDWLTYLGATDVVTDAAGLQDALTNAENGDVIMFAADISGDVTSVAKENVKFTIDGNGKTLNGSITIDGKSATITSAGLTIKNVNFNAAGIAYDACVRLGDSTTATRYVCNVTVENCTFTGVLAEEKVGVKSYTGGDKNITVTGCTATGMHSLAQLYVTEGVTFADCKVQNSKNGISVRASDNVVISGCNIDATAYGIRADGGACVQTLKNNTITAAKPVIVRKLTTAGYVLNLEGNTLTATSADGYQLVLTTGDDEAAYVAPTVSYTLTGADDLKVFK